MKKLAFVALMLAAMMALLPALADTLLPVGPYTITLPADVEQDELTAEDTDAGMTAYYFQSDDAYELAVYEYDAEGYSLSEYLEAVVAECTPAQNGTNTINGIEVGYYVTTESDETGEYYAVCYVIVANDTIYELVFYVANDENLSTGSAAAAAIVETLANAQ